MKNIKRTIALLLCTIICISAAMGDIVAVWADEGTIQETETNVGVSKTEGETEGIKEPETGLGSPEDKQGESSSPNPTESEEQKEQTAQENVSSEPEETSQQPTKDELTMDKPPTIKNTSPDKEEVAGEKNSDANAAPKSSAVVFTVENIKKAGIKDENFAQAIYDSIIGSPDLFLHGNTLTSNSYTSMEQLLNEFNGEIKASGKGIKDITGVSKLRSCTSINLSNNEITDINPLSVAPTAQSFDDLTDSQKRHYGTYDGTVAVNTTLSIEGNPIRKYPKWIGGRIVIFPSLSGKTINLNDRTIVYVSDGTALDAGEISIPLDLTISDKRVYLRESATAIRENPGSSTGAAITSGKGGRLEKIDIGNIIKSGKFYLRLQAESDNDENNSQLNFATVSDELWDDVNDDRQNFSWNIPVTTKVYTKVIKDKVSTEHSAVLIKRGLDDGAVKKGAKYSLFKKGDGTDKDVKLGEYTTDKNGQISVPNLEAGKYYFRENTDGAPNGYTVNPEPVEFNLSDGTIALKNKSGSVIDMGEEILSPEINGAYVLGGDEADSVHLTVTPPTEGGILDSLILKWTEGNQGGSPGTKKIVVGAGTDSDVIYVSNQEEAITKAEDLLKNCQNLGQNATISASFKQEIALEQKDSLAPVQVRLEAAKKLSYASGAEISNVPEGKFNFVLKNDPAYPNEPAIGIIEAVNGGLDGRKVMFDSFSIGNEITVDTPKDADGNYIYHYVISEKNDNDPNYTYDSETVKAEVTIGKKENSDELEIKNIVYKKGTPETESNEFTNTLLALPFEFTKVDGTNHETVLEGVKFALYECRNNNADHTHKEMVTKEIVDCWTLLEEAVSNRDGLVKFKDLPSGSYQLVEMATNPAYELPLGQWRIQVDVAADTVVIEAKGSDKPPAFFTDTQDSEKRMLPNYKKKVLPMAGGRGTAGFTFIGLGIVISGLAMFGCTGKKRRRRC